MTTCFLDRELIAAVVPGAMTAVNEGTLPAALLPLFSDGMHLQHWPNHDNHVHIRVSEQPTGTPVTTPPFTEEP